jgi:REP element-mobilizing transposase RayT
MSYTSGSHTVFHHRYHIVWITKYRYKVLEGALRERTFAGLAASLSVAVICTAVRKNELVATTAPTRLPLSRGR